MTGDGRAPAAAPGRAAGSGADEPSGAALTTIAATAAAVTSTPLRRHRPITP
jgi:hypothetical protein